MSKAKNTGIPYEVLTQQIFQALHDQTEVKNIRVQQNVILQGKTTKHQIDVYWKFERAGIIYRTVVQTKDMAQAVKQGQLFNFKGVLDDLPNQPRGIFVTRTGYQSGAVDVAKANGILLYELREPGEADFEGKITTIAVQLTFLIPNASDVQPIIDEDWVRAEHARLGLAAAGSVKIKLNGLIEKLRLLDETGQDVGSFHTVIKRLLPTKLTVMPGSLREHRFDTPTFVATEDPQFPRVKLLGIGAVIAVTSEVREMIWKAQDIVGFILREVGGGTRLFDHAKKPIGEQETDEANLEIPPQTAPK